MIARLFFTILMLLLAHSHVQAEQLWQKLPNGLNATAGYAAPKDNKPIVLIMHPFLQTSNFSVVANLSETLVDEGYGVFMPTLTLGIDSRTQSKPCEAIHTESFADKAEELAFWIAWLQKNHKHKIIVLGHSSGASLLIRLLSGKPDLSVARAILLSPVHYGFPGGAGMNPPEREQALKDQQAGKKDDLVQYKISFCDNYTTPRSVYLDITSNTEEVINAQLATIKIPTSIIYGSKDDALNPSWRDYLNQSNHSITVVPDGNHFFSGTAEFDMHDAVLDALSDDQ